MAMHSKTLKHTHNIKKGNKMKSDMQYHDSIFNKNGSSHTIPGTLQFMEVSLHKENLM